ncbi:MAG: hypothetical protein KAT75_00680 [Dehalococcoidia bacterium]|nr:hypothetical protein [Dehalococcoidia bacterium]
MTIDEAIEINESLLDGTYDHRDGRMEDALKLGIEALVFFKEFQKVTGSHQDARLPSETKE